MRSLSILTVALLLAGCASEGAPAAAPTPGVASSAAPIVTSETSGSIHGIVIDEEERPVGGVTVAIQGTGDKTDSAKNGEFTFNELPGGTYTVHAAALGYEAAARKVDVALGEVTEVRIQLKALEILGEPYVVPYHGVYFIVFDWFGVGQTTAIHPYLCTPCDTYRSIAPKGMSAFIEGVWTKSVDLPVVSETISFKVYTKPKNDTFVTGNSVVSAVLHNREGAAAPEAGVALLAKADLISVQVLSPGLTQVAIQQKVESWFSVGYNGPIPEGYSALPPT